MYTAILLNARGVEIRIPLRPFVILDLAPGSPGLGASQRRLDALLSDLSQLDPGYEHVPTTYRLAIYDEASTLIGHWTGI